MPTTMQNGLAEAPVNKSRKQIKERKNRTKKIRGVKKNAGACITAGHLPAQWLTPHLYLWSTKALLHLQHSSSGIAHNAGFSAAQHLPQQPRESGHGGCEDLT